MLVSVELSRLTLWITASPHFQAMVWPFSRQPDYEQRLAALTNKIRHSQLILTKYQNSYRRVKGLVTFYTLLVYTIYVAVVVAANSLRKPKNAALVTLTPGIIFLLRRVIGWLFNWQISRKESQLDTLNAQRNALIEEYKEKTDYYKIKRVVDEAEGAQEYPVEETFEEIPKSVPAVDDSSQVQPESPFSIPTAPERLSWMDRLMDIILGENEQSPNNRYALICGRCHHHNGLATYGQVPEQVVYVCHFCGFLNGNAHKSKSSAELEPTADEQGGCEPDVQKEIEV